MPTETTSYHMPFLFAKTYELLFMHSTTIASPYL